MNQLEVTLEGAALDAAHVVEARLREAFSEPTRCEVTILVDEEIDADAALRAPVVLTIKVDGEAVRTFHLAVREVRFLAIEALRGAASSAGQAKLRYAVELVHPLAFLRLRSDVRMFQENDAKEIVTAVLEGHGLAASSSFSLQRPPSPRTYCVQYRESDYDFISRLLEHEGIYYVIEHGDDGANIAFGDTSAGLGPIDGEASIPLVEDSELTMAGVTSFTVESVAVPDQVSAIDYDPRQPNLDLSAKTALVDPPTTDWLETAVGATSPAEAQVVTDVRAQELYVRRLTGSGTAQRIEMRAGATFELAGTGRTALAQSWLLTSVDHVFRARQGETASSDDTPTYESSFRCIPASTPFRPARVTPLPVVRGHQPAVVTGPAGSEIHPDELGRMKAKFFWDRLGPSDDKSSCWMRVTQLPIGQSMALARVGWEMMVVHLEGDPDRPLAISRVYNAEKVSPYGYPGAASQMSLQTPSSPGGGKSNEIRMSDGGGGQEFFLNASKNYDALTTNNKTETVGADEKITVGVNRTTGVGVDLSVDVGGSRTATVAADASVIVTADRTESIGGSETLLCANNSSAIVKGADTETVGGSHISVAAMGISRTTIGAQSLTVGGSMVSASAKEVSFAVAGAKSETVGGVKLVATGGPIEQSSVGALAITVGGVAAHAAGANFSSGTQGPNAITVGGIAIANAAGQVTFKAPSIDLKVGGVANFLGGAGVLTLTPGSASLAPLISCNASGGINVKGNPNLVG